MNAKRWEFLRDGRSEDKEALISDIGKFLSVLRVNIHSVCGSDAAHGGMLITGVEIL